MNRDLLESIKYSVKLLDGREITNDRKNADLCPICKNGLVCVNVFEHAKGWT